MKKTGKLLLAIISAGMLCFGMNSICFAETTPEEKLEEYYNTVLVPKEGELPVENLTSLEGESGIVTHIMLDTNKDEMPELWVFYYSNEWFDVWTYEISSKGEVIFTDDGALSIGFFGENVGIKHLGCFFADNGDKVTFVVDSGHNVYGEGWDDNLRLDSFEQEGVEDEDILANMNISIFVGYYHGDIGMNASGKLELDGYLCGQRYYASEDFEDFEVAFDIEGDAVEETKKAADELYRHLGDKLEPVGIQCTSVRREYCDSQNESIETMSDVKSVYQPYGDAKIYYLFDWKGYGDNETPYELSLTVYDN